MNTGLLKWSSVAGAALLIAGCASTRDQLHASMGQSSDQLVRALGQPDEDFSLQSGERVLQWRIVSTRNQPRHVYSQPRMTYMTSVRSHAVPDERPQLPGHAFDGEHVAVEACVVWALIGADGNVQQGAAHGSGC